MPDARALLRRYRDESLLTEHARWEAVRAQITARRYEPPEGNARFIITLDGIPGAGKSTTQRWLQPALGAAYFSMARFAEARGVSADTRREHQLQTGKAHPVDAAFIAALAACDRRFIVLEKFPRSVIEAATMLEAAHRHGWRFEVLHLRLPGDCVALSTQRQIDRGPRHGRTPEPGYAQHRALVHLARATSGRETLRAHGVPIHAFDMTRPARENEAAIRQALGLDFAALPWHLPPLQTLERVSRRLGIAEAWVAGGSLYRPFWNGRFGPAQLPTDVDVAVNHEHEVAPLLQALEREAPQERWSLLCPSTRLRERYGLETNNAVEAKRHATFMHRAGLVRLHQGAIELQLPDGVEACLRGGVMALNAVLLDALNPAQRAQVLRRETHHLPRALSDYPGLTVAPETSKLLVGSEHWREHTPRPVGTAFKKLKAAVQQVVRSPRCRRALTPPELEVASEILEFHQRSELRAEAPPLPVKRLTAPGCFEALTRTADDAAFAEWFLKQVHHHRPAGGADPWLKSVLDLTLFKGALQTLSREQSALHQGWLLERHLAQSVLQLKTDALMERLSGEHERSWLLDLRMCMRLAMLFHDTGKLLGNRPRRHTQISARLFARFKPSWFPQRLLKLTQWLIRTHDLFGAFCQGLTNKTGHAAADYAVELSMRTSYPGALDSQAAREALLEAGLPLPHAAAITKELWLADVGSISTLRWLLPVAALVERLLLVRQAPTSFTGHERRSRFSTRADVAAPTAGR